MSKTKWYIGLGIILLSMVGFTNAANTSTISDNLLSNNFLNDWTGTNDHFHGPNILAGVHNEYREQTITLSDHLEAYEIQGVTQSQFQAEVWFWNQYSQSVDLTQEIVDSNGMEYTNTITMSGTCTSWNGCGYEDSPTNTIIINDIASDYDITTRFSFSVPSQPNYHYAADVRNPELFVTYDPYVVNLTTADVEEFLEGFDKFFLEEETFIIFEELTTEPVELFDDYYTFDEDLFFTEEELPLLMEEQMIYEDELPEIEEEFEEDIMTEDVLEYFEEEIIEEEPEQLEEEVIEEEIIEEEKSLEEADPKAQAVTVLTSINKSGDIKLTLTDILIESDAFSLEVMIESQPLMTDTLFYEPVILYPNQLNLFDNRDIYMDVTYQANDPLTTYNSNIRDNQEQRYRLRQELNGMTWIN